MNLTISPHAREQAARKDIALAVIWAVAQNPQTTYLSFQKLPDGTRQPYRCRRCGQQQEKWTGEAAGVKVCLVVNRCCGTVVTLYHDQLDTPLRADQRANGVTRYRGRDGQWTDGTTAAQPDRPKQKPLTAKQRKALKKARHDARRAREASK